MPVSQLLQLRGQFFLLSAHIGKILLFRPQSRDFGRQIVFLFYGTLLRRVCPRQIRLSRSKSRRVSIQLIVGRQQQLHFRDFALNLFLCRNSFLCRIQCGVCGLKRHRQHYFFVHTFRKRRFRGLIRFCLRQLRRDLLQFLLRSGKLGFKGKLRLSILLQKRPKQFYYLRYGQFPVFGLLCVQCVNGILVTSHPIDILPDALARLIPLTPDLSRLLLQLILQHHIEVGLENIPKYLLPLAGFRLQQLAEIALRDHSDLRKLLPRQADDLADRRIHLSPFGDLTPIGIGQLRAGRLCCGSGPLCLRTLIRRIPRHRVDLAAVGKGKLHPRRHILLGILGAQHGRIPVIAAGLAKQRKGDGVKDCGLSRTGIARNQVKSAAAQAVKVQLLHAGIRAKAHHFQL